MAVCCCSLAGTAACQHCPNNQFATKVWTNTNVVNLPNTKAVPVPEPPVIETVVRGKWITVKYPLYECSVCGATYQNVGYGFNFCPNCGARMVTEDA